jgi:DNA-binding HxlR family transcriptional regulator
MPKLKRRSPCPVACTLDLVGDKWTLLVVRDLFCGKAFFKDFAASPEGIATNILADRLAKLGAAGLAEAHAGGYRLTPRGRSLLPVLEAVKDWGLAHIPGTEARLKVK